MYHPGVGQGAAPADKVYLVGIFARSPGVNPHENLFHRSKCYRLQLLCRAGSAIAGRCSRRDGKCVLVGGRLKGTMHQADVGEEERESVERAASVCPVKIIRIAR